MKQRINRKSPVPLYHQIAEALRNAIAVGELRPGERLPAVREAAGAWGVNLHTVRRAYEELAREGLLLIRGARGTEVVGRGSVAGRAPDLDAFLTRCAHTAQAEFALSQLQLGQLLLKRAGESVRPMVHVIECSREQAAAHCEELMSAWRVEAKPLVLFDTDELPSGILIGTYFHYNDIRQRWPDRLGDVRFVAIAPDASLPLRIPRARGSGAQRLLLCELDESKALNIAADLQTLFPRNEYRIEARTLRSIGKLPASRSGEVVLVSPRVWGGLSTRQRQRVLPVRYCVGPQDLEALGSSHGWQRARAQEVA